MGVLLENIMIDEAQLKSVLNAHKITLVDMDRLAKKNFYLTMDYYLVKLGDRSWGVNNKSGDTLWLMEVIEVAGKPQVTIERGH